MSVSGTFKKAAVATLCATPVVAQPYSDSMADCASIYQNAAQWVQSDDLAAKVQYGAHQWHRAAVAQSAAEGQPLSDQDMWDKIDHQTVIWQAKGPSFIMSQEFRDWTAYCKSFAKHTNVSYEKQ